MDDITEKAKNIQLIIFDVDGVLTNGRITYSNTGSEIKSFHVHDGLGMKLLQKFGIKVAIITARESDVVTRRMQELGISDVYQGSGNKVTPYQELKQKYHLNNDQIAYVGDDLPDLALIHRSGLGITVANAPESIKKYADMVTKAKAGKGVAREVAEFILKAQGQFDGLVQQYLNG